MSLIDPTKATPSQYPAQQRKVTGQKPPVNDQTLLFDYYSSKNSVPTTSTSGIRLAEKQHQTDDPVVKEFKTLDANGNLKIEAKEYTDRLVDDYVKNGKKLPEGYSNFSEYIEAKYEEFKKYAGDDCSMNIDEFRAMVEDRLKEMPQTQMPDGNSVKGIVSATVTGGVISGNMFEAVGSEVKKEIEE